MWIYSCDSSALCCAPIEAGTFPSRLRRWKPHSLTHHPGPLLNPRACGPPRTPQSATAVDCQWFDLRPNLRSNEEAGTTLGRRPH